MVTQGQNGQGARPAQPAQPVKQGAGQGGGKKAPEYSVQVTNDGHKVLTVKVKGGAWYPMVDERIRLAHELGGLTFLEPAVYSLDTVGRGGVIIQRWFYRAGLIYQGRTYYGTAEIDWAVPVSESAAEADNPLECAETSAIGRALSNANVGVLPKNRATWEEMLKAERKAEARASTPAAGQAAQPAEPVAPLVAQHAAAAGWGAPVIRDEPAEPVEPAGVELPTRPEPGPDGHYSMMLAFEYAKAAGIKGGAWTSLRNECRSDADAIVATVEDILAQRLPGEEELDITFTVDEPAQPAEPVAAL